MPRPKIRTLVFSGGDHAEADHFTVNTSELIPENASRRVRFLPGRDCNQFSRLSRHLSDAQD